MATADTRSASSSEGPPSVVETKVEFVAGYWAHGRYYSSPLRDRYVFPIDEEELNRLDIFHRFCMVARAEKYISQRMRKSKDLKVIDLGTGTGIWAIHLSEEMARLGLDGEILAVDMNFIQPQMIPANVRTHRQDIEEPVWSECLKNCDHINLRFMFGSLKNDSWPQVYSNALKHLAPGSGYIEQMEIDWTPLWDDDTMQQPSALKEWYGLFKRGMDLFDRSITVDSAKTKRQLEAAGFTNVNEQVIICFLNPGAEEGHPREIARWFNVVVTYGLEALSFMALIDKMGLSYEQAKDLCRRAVKEACQMSSHSYMRMHVWTARRPYS